MTVAVLATAAVRCSASCAAAAARRDCTKASTLATFNEAVAGTLFIEVRAAVRPCVDMLSAVLWAERKSRGLFTRMLPRPRRNPLD